MFGRFFKTTIGILSVPIVIGTASAFVSFISGISIYSGMLRLFERGVLFYFILHIFVFRPVYLYVLGHEFVHVLATWVCGGKVVAFKVTPQGGNVVTSKTNFFIELSPYFVPIYTLLIGPLFLIMDAIGKQPPFVGGVFIFLVGVTLAFHFAMTSEALRLQQPDIMKSGAIFSTSLIFVLNFIVVALVFSPCFGTLSFVDFLEEAVYNSQDIYLMLYNKTIGLVNQYRFW